MQCNGMEWVKRERGVLVDCDKWTSVSLLRTGRPKESQLNLQSEEMRESTQTGGVSVIGHLNRTVVT